MKKEEGTATATVTEKSSNHIVNHIKTRITSSRLYASMNQSIGSLHAGPDLNDFMPESKCMLCHACM